jgi:hypothetical protein
MRKRTVGVLGALALGLTACPPAAEVCTNGVDDNGDGFADCADSLCSADPACPGDAGRPCTAQVQCVRDGWFKDKPIDQCVEGQCTSAGTGIAVRLEVDTTAFNGVAYKFNAMSTRFVSKRALDGSAVDCAVLRASSPSNAEADGGTTQLDATGRFAYLAYEVTPINNGVPGSTLVSPFIYTALGSDFVIWNELWSGPPASATGQPQGVRWGWGCFETGAAVEPLVASQDCSPDGGTPEGCRTMRLKMPGPN